MRHLTLTTATASATIGIAVLAGCTPAGGDAEPSPRASASGSPSASASVEPSASASPSATPSAGTPLGLGCLDLVSLETMYSFDPNFALVDGFSPAGGSLGAVAVGSGGVACRWQQLTSGATIEVTAARPSAAELARLAAEAGATGAGRTFSASGDVGTVQAFGEDYWVTATSSYFSAAGDAALLVDSAVAAVG